MFDDLIEAWASGPVLPGIFAQHRGQYMISNWSTGTAANLDKDARDTIDGVLKFYGDKTAQYLSDLTHAEDPWREARRGLSAGREEVTA